MAETDFSPPVSPEASTNERPPLPPGIVAFVKRDCPTCELVVPILQAIAKKVPLTVYTQDDPEFPSGVEAIDDTDLTVSWPSFNIVEKKLNWNSATVIGRDSVELMGRPVEAWKVTTRGGKATLWIRQQPPYVVRREFHVNEELTIVWQIVEYPYASP